MAEVTVRAVELDNLQAVEQLLAVAEHSFRRVWLTNLRECTRTRLLFAATQSNEIRGVLGSSEQNPQAHTLCAAAFANTNDIVVLMAPLLRRLAEEVRSRGVAVLTYVGSEEWLLGSLSPLGFLQEDEIITFLKTDPDLPPFEQTESVRVRHAVEADLDAVVALDRQSFPIEWHYGKHMLLEAYNSGGVFLVAEDSDIVGYAYGDVRQGSAHLTRLAVAEGHRRHGVGARLLADMLVAFQEEGAWWITLNTQHSNTISQKLYDRFGFQPFGNPVPILVYRVQPEIGPAAS
jgi:ribosomal-protein-alanine N-acetyltransferase